MRLAVLGTGNMGRALLRGVLESGAESQDIRAWDRDEAVRQHLPASVRWESPDRWFSHEPGPEIILIAVKPSDVASAVRAVDCSHNVLWCSIAAGVSISRLTEFIGQGARICRIMPNTPMLVGQGASAFALSENCTEHDTRMVEQMLRACGQAVLVAEKYMDAVTGLSGSGPAYVYTFIEAMIDGGVSAGLPYDVARSLATETVRGAAAMVASSDICPAALRSAVMSPGGTTARGLLELEKNGFRFAVSSAVIEAARRSRELGA